MAVTKQKSASVSQVGGEATRKDQRIIRTRKKIDAAFVQLLHRRPYVSIRVSDITRKACVGRATFYAHYSSKHDLLRSQFNRIVAPMVVPRGNEPCLLDATALFAHIKASLIVYKSLMDGRDGGGARVLRECFEMRVTELFAHRESASRLSPKSGIGAAIVTRFVASSLLAAVETWVETGARESAAEMQTIFGKLVGGGLPEFFTATSPA
jgi:AcrR family transcriptional regulator